MRLHIHKWCFSSHSDVIISISATARLKVANMLRADVLPAAAVCQAGQTLACSTNTLAISLAPVWRQVRRDGSLRQKWRPGITRCIDWIVDINHGKGVQYWCLWAFWDVENAKNKNKLLTHTLDMSCGHARIVLHVFLIGPLLNEQGNILIMHKQITLVMSWAFLIW